jgi:hypothetical protein
METICNTVKFINVVFLAAEHFEHINKNICNKLSNSGNSVPTKATHIDEVKHYSQRSCWVTERFAPDKLLKI